MALKRPHRRYEEEYHLNWESTNTSFLKVALLLKNAGVDNYHFMLKLYDEDLKDVDPYDTNISPEMMGKVLTEVTKNFFYFIREVARIPEEGASTDVGGGTPFLLHRGNLAQLWAFEHNISHFLELPRQFGKTTTAVQRYLWQFSYGTTSSTTIFMNMDKAASVSNLTRLKDSRSLLPEYMQMVFTLDDKGQLKKDTDNVNEIKNKKLKNNIITKAGARNVQSAERVGRGLSVPSLWFDEFNFILLNETIHAAAIPAFSKASENAAKNDKPYCICITSTPGDLGTTHGAYGYDLKEKAGKFSESLYDLDPDEVETWLHKNSSNGMVYISFSFLQLGKTMEWFEEQCRRMNHNWMKIRRELLLQWNKASNNSPFLPEDIDELDTMARSSIKTIKINKYYEVLLYKELDPYKRYIISADISKGVGRDATAVAITDSQTLELVGLFINNTIRSKELKRFFLSLVLDHLPNSVLIIESNNIGDAIIEDLKASPLKHHLYYDFAMRLAEETRKDGVIQKKPKNRMVYGHEVTSATRPKMMELLLQFVSKHKEKIAVRELVDQIRHLEYKNEERIDHSAGHHDDAVFAYLAGIYIMFYGRNLPRFGLFNSFNFDGYEIEERDKPEDKVAKIFKKAKLQRLIKSNPNLAGLFEELIYLEDVDKAIDKEMYDIEASEDGRSTLFQNDGLAGSKIKKNAFRELNARAAGRTSGSKSSMFGVSDRHSGSSWW
jgi:hypothetical protein